MIISADELSCAGAVSGGGGAGEGPREAVLAKRAFDPVPTGAVHPTGWMRAQLEAQLHGIGGRWLGGGARVNDSKWVGGSGASLWPGAQAYPYWLNGAVALAAALRDPGLTAQVHAQMDVVFESAAAHDAWRTAAAARE